jgi:hypothetical protein
MAATRSGCGVPGHADPGGVEPPVGARGAADGRPATAGIRSPKSTERPGSVDDLTQPVIILNTVAQITERRPAAPRPEESNLVPYDPTSPVDVPSRFKTVV